jgi:hypothetical protein
MKNAMCIMAIMACALINYAQETKAVFNADDPGNQLRFAAVNSGDPGEMAPLAMWDPLLSYDYYSLFGTSAWFGVTFTDSEFWVSTLGSNDSITRISALGTILSKTTVPGLSASYGLAWDGTYIYSSTDNPLVKVVDPVTLSVVDTITINGSVNPAMIAFDSVLSGFWICPYSSNEDIYFMDMGGNLTDTLPFSIHQVKNITGGAVDHISPGGPFLWVFAQSAAPSILMVHQLQLPSGSPTGFVKDAGEDFLGYSAAGMFLSSEITSGKTLLGGIMRPGGPEGTLFGYDLEFLNLQVDIRMEFLRPDHGYYMIPLDQVIPDPVFCQLRNQGSDTIHQLLVDVRISKGANTVFTDSIPVLNLLPGTLMPLTTTKSFTPTDTGQYLIKAFVSIGGGQMDEDHTNDSLSQEFFVTDTLFARDDGQHHTPSGFSTGFDGIIGMIYEIQEKCAVEKVKVAFYNPHFGDSVKAWIRPVPGMYPQSPIAEGETYFFGPADTGLVWIDMKLPQTRLDPGRYYFYVEESGNYLNLGFSRKIHKPGQEIIRARSGSTWFSWRYGEWFGIVGSEMIRPVVKSCTTNFSLTADVQSDSCANSSGSVEINLQSSGSFSFLWNTGDTTAAVGGLTGGQFYTVTIKDEIGCDTLAGFYITPINTPMVLNLASSPDNGGGTGQASVAVSGGMPPYTFTWNDPSMQTTNPATGLTAGVYSVWVTDSYGCLNSDSVEVLSTVGIEDPLMDEKSGFTVFPNPAFGTVWIQLETEKVKPVKLILSDLTGRQLWSTVPPDQESHKWEIQLGPIPTGIYLFRIETQTDVLTRRVIIKP